MTTKKKKVQKLKIMILKYLQKKVPNADELTKKLKASNKDENYNKVR